MFLKFIQACRPTITRTTGYWLLGIIMVNKWVSWSFVISVLCNFDFEFMFIIFILIFWSGPVIQSALVSDLFRAWVSDPIDLHFGEPKGHFEEAGSSSHWIIIHGPIVGGPKTRLVKLFFQLCRSRWLGGIKFRFDQERSDWHGFAMPRLPRQWEVKFQSMTNDQWWQWNSVTVTIRNIP